MNWMIKLVERVHDFFTTPGAYGWRNWASHGILVVALTVPTIGIIWLANLLPQVAVPLWVAPAFWGLYYVPREVEHGWLHHRASQKLEQAGTRVNRGWYWWRDHVMDVAFAELAAGLLTWWLA